MRRSRICFHVGRTVHLLSQEELVCKTGLGDVLIGASGAAADYNGVANASHIKDKLVEMTHLNETIYAAGIASSYQSHKTADWKLSKRRHASKCLQTQCHTLSL